VATEPTLRQLFAVTPDSSIDVESVLRRSRARRTPRVLAIAGVGVLAIGGMVVSGLQLSGGAGTASDAGGAPTTEIFELPADAGAADSALDSTKRAAAETLNLCGASTAQVDTAATGLALTVDFPTSAIGSASVAGTVTLTNIGTDAISGFTAATPTLTLARDGIVVWHSNGPQIQLAREVALAPGESMQYEASFTAVVCTAEDDLRESFRDDLPPAPPGAYQLSAAIDVMGEFDALLVAGPAEQITVS
jgi:hypothetical protein